MQYVKITLGWLTHKTSQAPQYFFTGEARMYPASLNFCSSSWQSLETKCQCFKATLKLVALLRTHSAPHNKALTSFRSPRRSPGDNPWALPLPPWEDSPSLPGHPISFHPLLVPLLNLLDDRIRAFLTCFGDLFQYQVQVADVAPCADVEVLQRLQHLVHVIFGKKLVQRSENASLFCHLFDHRREVFERQRSHHPQPWHVKPFDDDFGHCRHADLQSELARGILVGDVASEGTEGGSNVITAILNLSPRLLVVSCRYTTTALHVRRLDVSFTRSSKKLTFDG